MNIKTTLNEVLLMTNKKYSLEYFWELFLSLPVSITKKFVILVSFLEFGALVTTGIFIIIYFYYIFDQNANTRAYEIGRSLESFAIESLVKNDISGFQKIIEKLSQDKSIRYIILQDKFGQAISHSNIHYIGLKFNDKNSVRVFYTTKEFYQNYYDSRGIIYTREYALPLNTPFGKIGYIRIGMNYYELVWKPLLNSFYIILIMIVFFTIIGIFIAIPALKILIYPVIAVKEATVSVASGDLTTNIKFKNNDEIGKMAQSFNKMIESQREIVSLIIKLTEEISHSISNFTSSTEEVTSATTQISETIQNVTKGAITGSEHTVQVNLKLESFVRLLENAKAQAEKSYTIAEQTYNISIQGKETMNLMNEVIRKIFQGSQQTLEKINKLNELSKKIENITSTINHISGQITLLALNASIEAARAGEYGKGFAVVADEISKLADQSSKQSKEVNQIVNQIISYTKQSLDTTKLQSELVNEGLQTNNMINEFFEKITLSANHISQESKKIKEIAEKEVMESNEVVINVNELNKLMQNIASNSIEVSKSLEETLKNIEEISQQSQKLNDLAIKLRKMVTNFKIK